MPTAKIPGDQAVKPYWSDMLASVAAVFGAWCWLLMLYHLGDGLAFIWWVVERRFLGEE